MRCDRQMFPPRQLLLSACERGEAASDLPKERKEERRPRKKESRETSLPRVPRQLVLALFAGPPKGMLDYMGAVHPYPTRTKRPHVVWPSIEPSITRARRIFPLKIEIYRCRNHLRPTLERGWK